jgi:predicted flap endonuclease-1-like 5' DNA nuclease
MNPFLVIGVFTVLLGIVVFWLQRRQDTADDEIRRVTPKKEITVVKKADWVAEEEPEAVPEPEPEPAPEATPEPELVDEPVPESIVDDISELAGVGPKYQQLLKAAGITSIAFIAESKPEELLKKLVEVNESEGITKRHPTMYVVERWIEAAKTR